MFTDTVLPLSLCVIWALGCSKGLKIDPSLDGRGGGIRKSRQISSDNTFALIYCGSQLLDDPASLSHDHL